MSSTVVMNHTPAPAASSNGFALVLMNLQDPTEREILYNQRKACGWDWDEIPNWTEWIKRGERFLFWITIPESEKGAVSEEPHQALPTRFGDEQRRIPVGHIALDWTDHAEEGCLPEAALAQPDGSVLKFSAFFILPEFGYRGLGRLTLRELERVAQKLPYGSPNCRRLTFTTLSERYYVEEGPDGKGVWDRMGMEGHEPRHDMYAWYKKMGYVWYKDALRHFIKAPDGTIVPLYDGYFYKDLEFPVDSAL